DHLAAVNAEAVLDRLRQVGCKLVIHAVHVGRDTGSRTYRLTTGRFWIDVDAKQRKNAIADKLVWLAAGVERRLRTRAQEAVNEKHNVEWQPGFSEPRRPAHIDEHADDVTLLADIHAAAVAKELCVHAGRQNWNDRHVRLRAKLTGQANRRIRGNTNTLQHEGFAPRRGWKRIASAHHAEAAGRTARAPSADARVWNPMPQPGFKHTQPLRNAPLPIRVGNRHQAALALAQGAPAARRKH